MKKLSLLLLVSILSITNFSGVFATEPAPVSKYDIDSFITKLRPTLYQNMFAICKKDPYVTTGDLSIIKASFGEVVSSMMTSMNKWKKSIELKRPLTVDELDTYNYVRKNLMTEILDPKRPSWATCDSILNSLMMNTWQIYEKFPETSSKVSQEYKKASLTTVKPGLATFSSASLSGTVAVVDSKKVASFIQDYPQYKGIIVQQTNADGKVVSHYVFMPQNEVNNRKADLNDGKIQVLTVDNLAKMYMNIAPDVSNGPNFIAPIRKIGSLYYMYKQYK